MESLKIKINNSYESEPSSGSGQSSLSENNDCANSDDENMNLPYLLKPPSYQNEVIITTTIPDSQSPERPTMQEIIETNQKRLFRYDVPVHSSQESPFKGFGDSPFGKLKHLMFNTNYENVKNTSPTITTSQPQSKINHVPLHAEINPSPGKLVFSNFYDTLFEENSCNARDMLLSNENNASNQCSDGTQTNPSSELSFNGKIKGLSREKSLQEEVVEKDSIDLLLQHHRNEEQSQQQQDNINSESYTIFDLTASNGLFFLNKYTNEKSPDLFGDDDTEPDKVNMEKTEPIQMFTYDTSIETTITLNTVDTAEAGKIESPKQNDLSSNNRSLNACPTESSFADDQTLDSTLAHLSDTENLLLANCKREREMYRRIRTCLSGVPPPPTLTIPQMDIVNIVLSRKEDIFNFLLNPDSNDQNSTTKSNSSSSASILKPTHSLEETKSMGWRDILGVRQHGLSFNLNKASESNEYLSLSVIERFVGAETASSYQISPSSAKKRNARLKMLTQSPGNRLSHLAKRRAVFSSANLATTSFKSTSSLGTQILLDKKKPKQRRKGTPKRKTPASKKKNARKTPSSARKSLFRCDLNTTVGPSRESSKRALFQSPAKSLQQKYAIPKPVIKPEIATRVEKSKRALFSPENLSQTSKYSFSNPSLGEESQAFGQTNVQNNQFKSTLFGTTSQLDSLLLKRKRQAANEDDDDTAELAAAQSSKYFRGDTKSLTPRALKIKSESFCIGAGSSSKDNRSYSDFDKKASATITSNQISLINSQIVLNKGSNSSNNSFTINNKIMRAQSEMTATTNSLTENQRKKLLWAVSQALQEKKITAKHENFKHFASVLARVVRRIFQEYYQKSSNSNSETMLRLAKKYSFNVVSGKNVDDIYFNAKAQIDENKRKSSSRLSGYIGPADYECRNMSQQNKIQSLSQSSNLLPGSLQNIFTIDTSFDSFGISGSETSSTHEVTTSGAAVTSAVSAQSSSIADLELQQQRLPIQSNATLQNSSSKSNLGGLVLRENVDCEQRRSAQKNFTGKDQRNVSPYAMLGGGTVRLGSGIKTQLNVIQDLNNANTDRAKRQILFDS